MSDLDPNSYWQRKVVFEKLSKTIPGLKELKTGDRKQYFDDDGELHFEVIIKRNERPKSNYGKLIDYIKGEVTAKPTSQIVLENNPYEIAHFVVFAVLNFYAKELTIGYGLNELANSYNDVTLIDHKNNEAHRLLGSIENEQLSYMASHNLDEGLLLKSNSRLRFKLDNRIIENFPDFLNKLTPEFKNRFANEEQGHTRIN